MSLHLFGPSCGIYASYQVLPETSGQSSVVITLEGGLRISLSPLSGIHLLLQISFHSYFQIFLMIQRIFLLISDSAFLWCFIHLEALVSKKVTSPFPFTCLSGITSSSSSCITFLCPTSSPIKHFFRWQHLLGQMMDVQMSTKSQQISRSPEGSFRSHCYRETSHREQ